MSSPRSRSKQPDPSFLTAVWGALWGVALGAWLLAPAITDTHHIQLSATRHWAIYLTALVLMFGVMGAFLAWIAGFALAVIEHLTVGVFRHRVWAYALGSGVLVIAAYGAEACLVHVMTFGSLDRLTADQAKQLGIPLLVVSGLFVVTYLLVLRRPQPPRPASLAFILSVVAGVGMISLVLRTAISAQTPTINVARLSRNPLANSVDKPLLFIGLDGATWRLLSPAIEAGSAPTLRALLESGAHGTIEALWPPYWSGAAWASIVTGLPREATGVYEDWGVWAPGLPPFQAPLAPSFQLNPVFVVRAFMRSAGVIQIVRPPRSLLRGTPVWELLDDAGVETAVIRFRFTYPPSDEADVIVSDWVGDDGWAALGARHRETDETVTPRARAAELLAPFRAPDSGSAVFDRLLTDQRATPQKEPFLDPIAHLRAASSLDEATFNVAESLLRANKAQPFLAIYFVGLDSVQHLFWPYRFPEDFATGKPTDDEIRRFGKVLDRYVEYWDQRLKMLLDSYTTRPNIVIVSDHGQGGVSAGTSLGIGAHKKDGVFLAAGPSIPKVSESLNVSYYDILPTLVDLKGFNPPAELTGHSLFGEQQHLPR